MDGIQYNGNICSKVIQLFLDCNIINIMNTISDQLRQLRIVIGKAKSDHTPDDSPTFVSELIEPQTPSLVI